MTVTDTPPPVVESSEVVAPLQQCKVAVAVGENTLWEASLVSTFGLAAVVDDLVKTLVADGLLTEDHRVYALCSADGEPLDHERSLDECGVKDGDTLFLLPTEAAQREGGVVEEISTALARATLNNLSHATVGTWRAVAWGVCISATLAVDGLLTRLWWHQHGWVPAAVSAGLTVLLVWAARRAHLTALGWCAIISGAATAALAVPAPPGAAHLVAAGSVSTVGLAALGFVTRRYVTAVTAAVIVGLFGTSIALIVAAGWNVTSPRIGVAVLLCVLGLITSAPNIAAVIAGIPGRQPGSITNRGLFVDAPEEAVTSEAPVMPVAPSPTLTNEQVAVLGRRANQAKTGVVLGACLLAVPAAWFAAGPRTWGFVVFVAAVCWVIGLRSRADVDRWWVIILAAAAPAGAAAMIARFADPTVSSTLTCVGLLAGLAGLCALMMIVLTRTKVSAPINKAIEISEYFPCLALSVPWALWLLGIWPVLRNLVP